jgi:hypothetical protein
MWDLQHLTTLKASRACYGYSFTSFYPTYTSVSWEIYSHLVFWQKCTYSSHTVHTVLFQTCYILFPSHCPWFDQILAPDNKYKLWINFFWDFHSLLLMFSTCTWSLFHSVLLMFSTCTRPFYTPHLVSGLASQHCKIPQNCSCSLRTKTFPIISGGVREQDYCISEFQIRVNPSKPSG